MLRFLATTAIAALTALTFATPSQALSCLPPTPESSFANYSAAEELYEIWTGRWIKINSTPEITGNFETGGVTPYPVRFRFQGRQVGLHGPVGQVRTFNVMVEPKCVGPWCAAYPDGGEQIVGFFERKNNGRRTFEPNACGGAAFPRTAENVGRLTACFNSGLCN